MATRTLQDLSKAVMEKLAVIDALEDPSASDHLMIMRRYAELYEGLAEEQLAYWPESEIPLVAFPALSDLVALHAGPAFGRPIVSVTDIEAAEVPIKRRLRRHTHKRASGVEAFQVDY